MKRTYKKGLSVLIVVLLAFGLLACHASYSGSINSTASAFVIK